MKLIEILKSVVKTEENSAYISTEELCYSLNIGQVNCDLNKFEEACKCYWIAIWQCTDTPVGYTAIYLKGELVSYTYQSARKSDMVIKYIDQESSIKMLSFLLSITESESLICTQDELEEDISVYHKHEYSRGIYKCDYRGMYEGKEVIVKSIPDKSTMLSKTLLVEFVDTHEEAVIKAIDYEYPFHIEGYYSIEQYRNEC